MPDNIWTDITIETSCRQSASVAAIAESLSGRGVYIEDYSSFESDIKLFGPIEIIDDELLKKAKNKSIAKVHVYIAPDENPQESLSFIEAQLKECAIEYKISTESIADEDWANNWKQYFSPLPVGRKLIIVPSWLKDTDYEGKDVNRIPLYMDPGMAFGSGQHETTKLCLELIEEYITEDSTLLDIGTGSGILAIGATLLGAKSTVGVDIDELAVKIAYENAVINGIEQHFEVVHGSLTDNVHGRYDIISANIVADIIKILVPDVHSFLSKDGVFIASGILIERRDEVCDFIRQNGFTILKIREDNAWCSIACRL